MKFKRHRLAVLAGVTAAGAATICGGTAIAVTASEETSPPIGEASGSAQDADELAASSDPDAGEDDRRDALSAAVSPAPTIALSGGLACSIPSTVEASTRWRYGRARSDASIDETTSHVRVSGSASGCDGLKMDFSVDLVLPALRLGSYGSSPNSGAPARTPTSMPVATNLWASLWARTDRASATPEVEWDTRFRGGSSASLMLTITSLAEVSHTSERPGRDGTVTLETTRFGVHGSIVAVLPCARAVASRRSNCRTETLLGSF